MIYYKVNPKKDQTPVYRVKGKQLINDGYILVGNELYTGKELTKMFGNRMIKETFEDTFEKVNVSKKKVYWFFGARFEMEKE